MNQRDLNRFYFLGKIKVATYLKNNFFTEHLCMTTSVKANVNKKWVKNMVSKKSFLTDKAATGGVL